jgi:hypothetical protein
MEISHTPACNSAAFARTVATLQRMIEPPRYRDFLGALADPTRAAVERPFGYGAWLPLEHWTQMIDAAHRVALSGDAQRMTALSEESVQSELHKLNRATKLTTPRFAMTRAIKLWDIYTRHSGTVEIAHLSPQSCEVSFIDVPAAESEAFLPFVRGLIQAVLRASGLVPFQVEALPSQSWRRRTLRAGWQA